jgi:hypothetical protein
VAKDKISMLEHVSVCESCAETMYDLFAESGLINVPSDLKANILTKLHGVRESGLTCRKSSIFAGYSFRVGIAMCISLLLIFSGWFNLSAYLKKEFIPVPDFSFMNTVTQDFRSFSDRIINMEVVKND